MAGSTAPYSIAGTLLQAHIEVLMLAAMTQILKPGHPVIYATGLSVTDLQTGADLYYTMDKVLWKIGAVQLGRAENMPTWAECGGAMTYRYDPQCGAEGMLFMLAAHASGADMISGFGSCHNAMGNQFPAAMRGTFALELGKAIAATPAILNAPTVLAAIRSFLLAQSAGGGADGSELVNQFNTGLSATSQDAMLTGSASASHPPPIAGPYAGQQTR
jgi:hypothetical protein